MLRGTMTIPMVAGDARIEEAKVRRAAGAAASPAAYLAYQTMWVAVTRAASVVVAQPVCLRHLGGNEPGQCARRYLGIDQGQVKATAKAGPPRTQWASGFGPRQHGQPSCSGAAGRRGSNSSQVSTALQSADNPIERGGN